MLIELKHGHTGLRCLNDLTKHNTWNGRSEHHHTDFMNIEAPPWSLVEFFAYETLGAYNPSNITRVRSNADFS